MKKAIFIHSFWRSNSTYFWSKFRPFEDFLCFYEPFNEMFGYNENGSIFEISESSWGSGHSALSKPYFEEYKPLAQQVDGRFIFENYNADFAVASFFEESEYLPEAQKIWIENLIKLASSENKIPVLGFTRTMGRINQLANSFPESVNIILHRDASEVFKSNLRLLQVENNPYFCVMYVFIIAYNYKKSEVLKKYFEGEYIPSLSGDIYEDMLTCNKYVKSLSVEKLFKDFYFVFSYCFKNIKVPNAIMVDFNQFNNNEYIDLDLKPAMKLTLHDVVAKNQLNQLTDFKDYKQINHTPSLNFTDEDFKKWSAEIDAKYF